MVAVSGSGALCVMPAGLAWCSRVVAGECCCRVLLPHLSPVVIDDIDCVGAVVIAAHPPARGSRCRTGGAGGCRHGCIPVVGVIWRLCPSQGGRCWCGCRCAGSSATTSTAARARSSSRYRGWPSGPRGLQAALAAIGLALAGRPGSRLAIRLGMGASRSTLPHLRLVFPGAAPQPARRGNGRPDGLRRLRVTGRADTGWVVTVAGEIRSIAQIISRATRAG